MLDADLGKKMLCSLLHLGWLATATDRQFQGTSFVRSDFVNRLSQIAGLDKAGLPSHPKSKIKSMRFFFRGDSTKLAAAHVLPAAHNHS